MIAVFSGTKDGRMLIDKLLECGHRVLALTATEYGEKLIAKRDGLEIHCGRLDDMQMKSIYEKHGVGCVVDATHPYASEASRSIMKSAEWAGLNYFRYERKAVEDKRASRFDDYNAAIDYLNGKEGGILLAIGSNNMDVFAENVDAGRLYFRVLPTSGVIKKCERLGVKASRIIAMQGPFSRRMNEAMYEDYGVKFVVTKDSGEEGGVREKIEAAIEKGVEVIMINRPKVEYRNLYHEIDELIENISIIG